MPKVAQVDKQQSGQDGLGQTYPKLHLAAFNFASFTLGIHYSSMQECTFS